MIETVKIPSARLPVLIGKSGSIKKEIEKNLNVRLFIGEDITIKGDDGLEVMDAKNIILAIGRGFSPDNAFKLLHEENTLCIIQIGKDEKKIKRIKSRIIGEKGRARENIERLTNTNISVYGKTISVIGTYENVQTVSKAIDKFIKGLSHKAVYAFLEKQRAKRE